MRCSIYSWIAMGCAFSASMEAADSSAKDQDEVSRSQQFLEQVAGVYKDQFENGDVSGDKFQSENILEVVPVDNHAAYVRMHLEFFNGHVAAIYGIARYSDHNSLIYDNEEPGENHCVVEYVWTRTDVTVRADYEKTPGCSNYHGARGTLNAAHFKITKRRAIRYLQRLKASSEYKSSLTAYLGKHPE